MNEFLTAWQPRVLSLLRFIAGFLFAWHGMQKLFNYPVGQPGTESSLTHFTNLSPLILVAGALEFFGGLLLIVGLFTRWTAFVLSGLMAVAYFMAHGLNAFLPIVNKGELAVLYSFVFFFLFFAGGGSVGLDSLLKKSDN